MVKLLCYSGGVKLTDGSMRSCCLVPVLGCTALYLGDFILNQIEVSINTHILHTCWKKIAFKLDSTGQLNEALI